MLKLFCLVIVLPMSFILADQLFRPLTSEQRWEPVYQIDGGVKGDKLMPRRHPPKVREIVA